MQSRTAEITKGLALPEVCRQIHGARIEARRAVAAAVRLAALGKDGLLRFHLAPRDVGLTHSRSRSGEGSGCCRGQKKTQTTYVGL